MTIVPLPVFEDHADPVKRGLAPEEISRYAALRPPESVVVRYGRMRQIGEFPCSLETIPGCGTKFVIRSPRGIEIGEMLTTTCSNGGCGKAITRKAMLNYIEASGGKRYPFTRNGRILRIATPKDLTEMVAITQAAAPRIKRVAEAARELELAMEVVDLEPVLSEDQLTIYYMSEDRVDFRELVRILAAEFSSRIEMRQVGSRDVARLQADYERCGQHCCCRQFLKILRPVPMRAAKMQKATLDPLKISGRCGRLMCCLRYEDAAYVELKKKLPHRRSRVGTPDGPGIVISTQILTQLVQVELEHDRTRIAVTVEELLDPEQCPKPGAKPALAIPEPLPDSDSTASQNQTRTSAKSSEKSGPRRTGARRTKRTQPHRAAPPTADPPATSRTDSTDSTRKLPPKPSQAKEPAHQTDQSDGGEKPSGEHKKKRRRRRGGRGGRGGRRGPGHETPSNPTASSPNGSSPPAGPEGKTTPSATTPTPPGDTANPPAGDHAAAKKKRRRRRGKRKGKGNNRPEQSDNPPSAPPD